MLFEMLSCHTHVFGLPAATECCLFRNVLHIDHVYDFSLVFANMIIAASILLTATSPSSWTEGQVTGISNAGNNSGGWNEGKPIFDCNDKQIK